MPEAVCYINCYKHCGSCMMNKFLLKCYSYKSIDYGLYIYGCMTLVIIKITFFLDVLWSVILLPKVTLATYSGADLDF